MAQLVKNPPAMWETWLDPWLGRFPRRRERLPTLVFWPGEFHGLYSPWGLKESETTEQDFHFHFNLSFLLSSHSLQFSSVTQSGPTLCCSMDCSMSGFPVHHKLPELTQTHVRRVSDAIQPSHPLLSPSPPVFSLS